MVFALEQFSDIALLILRFAIAAIFFYHALPKLKNAGMMAQMTGIPVSMVFLLGMVEFFSSLGMIFGIYIQVAALLLSVVMIGAIGMKIIKWSVPFAAMDKTGWEFDLILLAANLVILVNGGGGMVLSA